MAFQLGDRVKFRDVEATVIGTNDVGNDVGDARFTTLIGWKEHETTEPGYSWEVEPNDILLYKEGKYLEDINKYQYAYWVDDGEIQLLVKANQTLQPNGLNCKSCANHFPFATSNQPDGTLLCWSCRNYPHYK